MRPRGGQEATGRTPEARPASVAVWIRRGEIDASKIDCKPWNSKLFEASLQEIRSLTKIKDPQQFIPRLQSICSENGVAVVIARTPKGCPASGATKFLSDNKALLMLSFRHLTDDHFWFAFFHEAGHLILHGKNLFLEGTDLTPAIEEGQANEFAERTLIPAEFKNELLGLRAHNAREIIKLAVKMGVSPGIVVGQLHHLGLVSHKALKTLQRHYKWDE